jgi:hypothetical protein
MGIVGSLDIPTGSISPFESRTPFSHSFDETKALSTGRRVWGHLPGNVAMASSVPDSAAAAILSFKEENEPPTSQGVYHINQAFRNEGQRTPSPAHCNSTEPKQSKHNKQ